MHISLAIISNDRLGPLAIPFIPFNVNAQAAIHLESQQHFIINRVSSSGVGSSISFHALEFELTQASL